MSTEVGTSAAARDDTLRDDTLRDDTLRDGGATTSSSTTASASSSAAPARPPAPVEGFPALAARWRDIQAEFVDEPQRAVQDADTLVQELVQQIADSLSSRRTELHGRWSGSSETSTEDLRVSLQHYRALVNQLAELGTRLP